MKEQRLTRRVCWEGRRCLPKGLAVWWDVPVPRNGWWGLRKPEPAFLSLRWRATTQDDKRGSGSPVRYGSFKGKWAPFACTHCKSVTGRGRLGDCRQATRERKTGLSAARMLLILEKPLGGCDLKWRLFPRDKSTWNLQELRGRRKKVVPAGRLYICESGMESEVEKRVGRPGALRVRGRAGETLCQARGHPSPRGGCLWGLWAEKTGMIPSGDFQVEEPRTRTVPDSPLANWTPSIKVFWCWLFRTELFTYNSFIFFKGAADLSDSNRSLS